MTEKLKELLPNPFCVDYQHPHNGQGFDLYDDAKMIEYGKRIVQECIQLAFNEGERFYGLSKPDLALAMENFENLLSDHFGLKNE